MKRLLRLFYLAAIVDLSLTLLGQDVAYWQDFSKVNEAAPHAAWALQIHPVVYIAGAVVYLLLVPKLLQVIKGPYNLIMFFTLSFGHIDGGTSWLWHIMKNVGIYNSSFDRLGVTVAWLIAGGYLFLLGILFTRAFVDVLNGKLK